MPARRLRAASALGFGLAAMMAGAAVQAGEAKDGEGQAGDDWASLQLGGVVIVSPKYEGASGYRVIGAPIVAPSFMNSTGRFQFKGIDDLRLRVFQHGGFEAGPLAGWRFGRDEEDGSRLRGLGDVDGGLVVGGYMAYSVGILKPFLSYHHQVTGDDGGGVLRFGAEAKFGLGHGAEMIGTAGASYADANYMDAYFSVTPAQSAASAAGLAAFDADAGVKDVFIGLAATVPLSELWTLRLNAKYTRLVGDAADSPIVESENQFTGGLGLTYRMHWR